MPSAPLTSDGQPVLDPPIMEPSDSVEAATDEIEAEPVDDVGLEADMDCPPPYRDGKMHVLSEKCSTCVFRGGNIMHLEPGRLTQMVKESIAADAAITCHQTLPYGEYDVEGQAVCRGFYDKHGDKVLPLRLAGVVGIIEEQAPPTTKRPRRSNQARMDQTMTDADKTNTEESR